MNKKRKPKKPSHRKAKVGDILGGQWLIIAKMSVVDKVRGKAG